MWWGAVAAVERAAEGGVGGVADVFGDLAGGLRGCGEQVGGLVEALLGDVGRRWLSKQACEPAGEGGAGQVGALRELIDGSVVGGVAVDGGQDWPEGGVHGCGEPARCGVAAGSPDPQGVNEQQVEDAGDHDL